MKYRSLLYTIILAVVLAVLPFIALKVLSGSFVQKVPIEFIDDSLYYFSRAVEVSQGHLSIGNPYILEYRDDLTVAFFVADWMWSIPLLLGASLGLGIIINQVFWFVVLAILFFLFFKEFGVDKRLIPWLIAFSLLSIYWFEARPVAMQVVFPIFVAFLVFALKFLKNPHSKKIVLLGIFICTLSVYVYTYLAQIIAVVVGIGCLASLFSKFKPYRKIWIIAIGTICVSIPFLLYTWNQIHAPFYQETLARIGLTATHLIGFSAVFYSFLALLPAVFVFIQRNDFEETERTAVFLVSAGLVVATLSNVVTGKDLELPVHIGRFVELWAVLMLSLCVWRFYISKSPKPLASRFALILLIMFVAYGFSYQFKVWSNLNSSLFAKNYYSTLLDWLAEHSEKDSVIFSNFSIGTYVPILTDDYVLYHPNAELYLMSDEETADRFIVSRVFEQLTLQQIKDEYRKFGGAGNAVHGARVRNRAAKICMFLRLRALGWQCGELTNPIALKGEHYFAELFSKHARYASDPLPQLQKYKVAYVVRDKQNDKWNIPPALIEVWEDERFVIYAVPRASS